MNLIKTILLSLCIINAAIYATSTDTISALVTSYEPILQAFESCQPHRDYDELYAVLLQADDLLNYPQTKLHENIASLSKFIKKNFHSWYVSNR